MRRSIPGMAMDSPPLLYASVMGKRDAVQLLLFHNADPLVRDNEGNTPLHHVVAIGDFGSAQLLLERNVEVNAQNDKGSTPLHQAAQGWRDGYPEVVRLLLDHGADADVRNLSGMTPSEVARGPRQQEIVQMLSQHAAE
ncbi:ankyrin repeat protein [Lactarius deliciosus]|nr:ankyrin repeat protein [Lactarius deliciosus]